MPDYGDDLNKTIDRYKWVVMIYHAMSLVLAVATFSVCVWIRFDLDFWEWVVEIDWYSYWYAMYLIAFTMVCVAIHNIVGVVGTVKVTTPTLR